MKRAKTNDVNNENADENENADGVKKNYAVNERTVGHSVADS
jgi:hypothetical protein